MLKILWRVHREERGTSLTEFAIMLPIFVMTLTFITYVGVFGHYMTEEWNQTQRDLWFEVRAEQELGHVPIDPSDPLQWETSPQTAGSRGLADLAAHPARPWPEELVEPLGMHEGDTLRGLRDGGHWGESYHRTRPADGRMNFFVNHNDRSMTASPNAVIGGSGYAAALVDDANGSPMEYVVNRGLPMVVGASVRYGVAQSVRESQVVFAGGWSMDIKSEYNVLVPPRPPHNAGLWAREVARGQLDNYQPYAHLLGIANEQPLQTATAPGIPGTWSN
jgi:hypothetical protein